MTRVKLEKPEEKPKAFTIKYKRPRGSRACLVCRLRKVRCDAEMHMPCTNCITFGCECTLPQARKRGAAGGSDPRAKRRTEDDHYGTPSTPGNTNLADSGVPFSNLPHAGSTVPATSGGSQGSSTVAEPVLNISQVSVPPSLTSSYKTRPLIHKKELLSSRARASLTFLGLSSIGPVAKKVGENHVQLTADLFDIRDESVDSVELEILKLRGAFFLPSKELSIDIINSYFEHVHPLMPVINRTEFMRKFMDPNDSPLLMLLQAVLLCGCRVSQNPLLFDSNGSNNLACLTFFRRAKALYETNYESDPVSLIQTIILIGLYWEGPEDVTKNSFYWTRVAVGLAHGFGLQRDISSSTSLSNVEKKIWRRIWWCLFEKDRNVAIAFGRPSVIDLNDCDVPMLTIDDFNEDEPGNPSPYPVNVTQALYFIHLVKLAEITGIIVKHQYSVKAELNKKNKLPIIQHCDMLMGIWFTNLPRELEFSLNDTSTQHFYSCLLNAQYYNRLYLIHRSNLLRMARLNSTNPSKYKYPSWGISFQAARMISIISKILLDKQQICYSPVMFVYILFLAIMMLIYHVDLPNHLISSAASDSLFVLRAVLKELSKYWPIAGVLLKLFEKYANDKIKRAHVIEVGSKMAEYEEMSAENRQKTYYEYDNDGDQRASGENNHHEPLNNVESTDNYSPNSAVSPTARPMGEQPLDQLVHQLKQSLGKKSSSEQSPTSSTQSFPDISLVTENLPANQTFFDNFEPTQLFPDIKPSLPPSRAQSPPTMKEEADMYADTPGVTPGALNTNFVDSSFINMNLQSTADKNFLTDDIGLLFNFND